MMRWYIDTSAMAKLLVEEAESVALAGELDSRSTEVDLVASYLLETELRRMVHRIDGLTHKAVSEVLDEVSLYALTPSMMREAGYLPDPSLRSLDAVHLAVAIRLGVDGVVTYDVRMADAARGFGLPVVAPSP